MPDNGHFGNGTYHPSSTKSDDGNRHAPPIAAVRLAQEASELTRKPISGALHVARDVTQDFIAASTRLLPGELIKDENFTLFEAVGALEIMDSKMDSGYIPPGDCFMPAFDVTSGLEPSEVLWIMEELFRFEMAFHDGYPLSQNLFTSLHIFNLIAPTNKPPYNFHIRGSSRKARGSDMHYDLVHIVLRAYCVAVIKCCQLTLHLIQSQTFFEEEDFVTFLFGRELLPKLGSIEARRLLTDAIEWLNDASIEPELKAALTGHLEMRECALICMDEEEEQWGQLKTYVEKIESRRGLSKPLRSAFSDKVQRQLATSTPPRPMPDLSWQESCTKWKQLCDDVLAAYHLTRAEVRQSSHTLQNATWAFAYRNPAPNTFARSKMQDILTGNDAFGDDMLHFDHLLADIRELVLAGDRLADPTSFQIEVPSDPRHICSRIIEEFMSRAIGEYLNLFRMICQNRCRMRRTFTQAVPLLDDIESEARAADERLNDILLPHTRTDYHRSAQRLQPLTLWSRFYKLQMVEWVIQLGFETDIYLLDELGSMYMVLLSFSDQKKGEIEAIDQSSRERLERGGFSDRAQESECAASALWLQSLALAANVNVHLAGALMHVYVTLERLGVIDTAARPYSTRALQHEARMKPLLTMHHDAVPSYEVLQRGKEQVASSVRGSHELVAAGVAAAKAALAALRALAPEQVKRVGSAEQWRAELKRLETVCVAVSVASSQLLSIARKYGKEDAEAEDYLRQVVEVTVPPPEKRYHYWWVVPQVREREGCRPGAD